MTRASKSTRFLRVNISCAGRLLRSVRIPTTAIEPCVSESRLVGKSLDCWYKQAIVATLDHCDYNGVKAMDILGIPQSTFYRRCRKYRITIRELKLAASEKLAAENALAEKEAELARESERTR